MPDLSKDPNANKPSVKRPDTPLASTPEAKFSYTDTWQRTKNNQDANEKKGNIQSGIEVKDGVASAKPYEKRFIDSSKSRTNASIVNGKNEIVSSSKEGSSKSRDELRRKFVGDSTDTMNRRNNNANYFNLTKGSKPSLTDSDKKTLLKSGKAKLS